MTLVVVQREWNGWQTALASVADLEDVHWLQPAGAPRPLIHAYIPCAKLRSGSIPHDCDRTSHHLLVCVLKCHTTSDVFETLTRRAGEAPTVRTSSDPRTGSGARASRP